MIATLAAIAAQAPVEAPDALVLAGWLGCLFFVAAGANQVMKLLDRFREKPPPAETYVTKIVCGVLHDATLTRIADLDSRFERFTVAADERARRTFDRIEQQSMRFEEALRDLPSKIIVILKNTGAIS